MNIYQTSSLNLVSFLRLSGIEEISKEVVVRDRPLVVWSFREDEPLISTRELYREDQEVFISPQRYMNMRSQVIKEMKAFLTEEGF